MGRWVDTQSCSGRFGTEKPPLSLPGIEGRLLGRPARRLVSTVTELVRLPFFSFVQEYIRVIQDKI